MTEAEQYLASWFGYLTIAHKVAGKISSQAKAASLADFGKLTGSIFPAAQQAWFIGQFAVQSKLPGVSSTDLTNTTTFISFVGNVYNTPNLFVLAIVQDAAADSSPYDSFQKMLTSVVFADTNKQSNLLSVLHNSDVYPLGFIPPASTAKLIAQFTDPVATIADSLALITPA